MPPKRNRQDYDEEDPMTSRGGGMLHLAERLIPRFSGQDKTYPAARWIQDVEDNAEVFGWTAVQQLLMARRSLTGTAELWLRSERTFKTWEDLKTQISKEFPDTVDVKTIHEMMSARHKKNEETCLEYLFVMKELGKRGKMPDNVAIKYIVEGIKDNEVNKVMLYGVSSYGELKEKLKIYEQLKENMSSSARESNKSKPDNKPVDKTNRRVFTRCYSCGEMNHASSDCPHKDKGLKCFKCNQFGHISSHCKMSQATTSRGPRNELNVAAGGEVGSIAKKSPSSNVGGAADGARRNFVGQTNVTTDGGHVGCIDTNCLFVFRQHYDKLNFKAMMYNVCAILSNASSAND